MAVGKIGGRFIEICFHVYQGKSLICQVKVGEMSGNFESPGLWRPCIAYRVSQFKCFRVLDDLKISEDNQKLRPGCPCDYQIFCGRIDPKILIPIHFSSYLSLTNKNSSSDLIPHTYKVTK